MKDNRKIAYQMGYREGYSRGRTTGFTDGLREGRRRPRSSIIVLNFNGRHFLAESIPRLQRAVNTDGGGHEIIVVDNGSNDGSRYFMERRFPEVQLIALPHNLGFAAGNNVGVRAARHEIVILLNNDVLVKDDFLPYLLEHLANPEVFAVSPKLLQWDERTIEAEYLRFAYDSFGRVVQVQPHQGQTDQNLVRSACPTWYAPACAAAYNRQKYLELGGLETLYRPFHWDEVALSYRAWKRGWQVLYEPQSVVYHYGHGTTPTVCSRQQEDLIWQTNRYLFMWSCLDGSTLQPNLKTWPTKLRGPDRRALWRALRRLPAACSRRWRDQSHWVKSDRELSLLIGPLTEQIPQQ